MLKAVQESILNGGDTKMSGASFTALGSNLYFCGNYLSRSLPPCCKLLPGFDEKHICAEMHWLSGFFSAFSAMLLSVSCTWFSAVQQALHAQLVCHHAVCEACTLSLCCLHLCVCSAFRGFSQVCLAQVSRKVAGYYANPGKMGHY